MKKYLLIMLLFISINSLSNEVLKPEIIYNSEVITEIVSINNNKCLLSTPNGLKIFDLKTKKISDFLKNLKSNIAFNYLSNISFDGKYYYIREYSSKNLTRIYLYSIDKKLLKTFEYKTGNYLIMSKTGKYLLKRELNNYSIINTLTQKKVQTFKNLNIIPRFIVSPDKNFIIFSDYSSNPSKTFLYIYNLKNGNFIKKITINDFVYSLNIFPYINFYKDEFYILAKDNLYIFNLKTYTLKTKLLKSKNNFCASYFVSNNNIYIQNNYDILVFDKKNKKLIKKLRINNYESLYDQIIISKDENYLIGIKFQESRVKLYKLK
ncbi:hypothetical protein OSSY52_13320 [Tepiditoga spiralis]|uniref:Uncharacterized protein n=1 Tax=Tepiditoga spiralis TaxID=2108365 RepID=A0A7G1G4B1_9BACT|nr:hypothetical protein [Tepiditoga spiralis]BBE31191.1 hypothetical protein OSSY52_13320 [Tepiditoga spiralis]